jgi:hypothetical protein
MSYINSPTAASDDLTSGEEAYINALVNQTYTAGSLLIAGGTGAIPTELAGTSYQLATMNAAGNAVAFRTLEAGTGILINNDATSLTISAPIPVFTGDLTDLSDVTITAVADGQTLAYSAGSGQWVNSNAGTGDMILAAEQTVTGLKTFDTTKLAMKGSSTGTTAIASANASANNYTQTLQAATGTIALTSDIPSLTGYVNTSGTPADNQLAIFTDADTVEGDAGLTFNAATDTLSIGDYLTITSATGNNLITAVGAGELIEIYAANGTTGAGGEANLYAGNGAVNGNGGAAQMYAGNGAGNGSGGNATVYGGGGGATGSGGSVNMIAGDGATGGGDANIEAGSATAGNTLGGTAYIGGGDSFGTVTGGAALMYGGTGGATSGLGGEVAIYGGYAGAGNANGGSVALIGGTKTGSGVNGSIQLAATYSKWQTSIVAKLDVSNIASTAKTFTFPNASGTLALTTIADNTGFVDGSGNELLWFQETGSAANYLEIQNGATLTNPTIRGEGSDADVGVTFVVKGTGKVVIPTATIATVISPATNDGAALGAVTTGEWSDLFLAEGGVINWDNGDATLTQTGNVVKLAGAALETDGNIELGDASDTTLSRSAAGVLAVEGVVIPSISSTNTLTNKRVTKRTGTTTSHATPTINTDNVDFYSITAQTEAITSMTTNLSGTPTEGQTLWIAITGTAARAITWGASFEASTVALPTTTVTTARLDVGFVWNTVTSKWRCIASA